MWVLVVILMLSQPQSGSDNAVVKEASFESLTECLQARNDVYVQYIGNASIRQGRFYINKDFLPFVHATCVPSDGAVLLDEAMEDEKAKP